MSGDAPKSWRARVREQAAEEPVDPTQGPPPGPPFAELRACTNFSFLEGASHPHEMIAAARALGLHAITIADTNTLAGMVRTHEAARKERIRLIVGCRLVFTDGSEMTVLPRDRAAYGRLCRLLSIGKSEVVPDEKREKNKNNVIPFPSSRPPGESREPDLTVEQEPSLSRDDQPESSWRSKGHITKAETRLSFDQACALGEGLIALVPAPTKLDDAFATRLKDWRQRWPDELYLAATPLWRGDDRLRLARLAGIARAAQAPMVATNAALYHGPERRELQDVLACVRMGTTIAEAGLALEAHAERHLKHGAEMAALFAGHPEAIAHTIAIADACTFSLDELSYSYPDEPVPPGWTPGRHLIHLVYKGARERWPGGVPAKMLPIIAKELRLIRKLRYATYFITVHDIVQWARHPDRNILCQGRGSAANSVVCYCLFVTAIDPTKQDVLIERFISTDRQEPPDIDVDFEHERREEVMQYVYRRYGRHRAAIVATVIHYRSRSAIRDVGKALGLTEDITARLADTVWGSFGRGIKDEHVDRTGLDRDDPRLAKALELTALLTASNERPAFPRHLSQHVGGYVLTDGPLVESVPVGNAAMQDRTFIEWDKDDIDALKMMKVDILALGMLTALRKGLDMLRETYGMAEKNGRRLELATIAENEKKRVYRMLQKADSLGVFQVESRAQMNMLPRLLPEKFYDLVVQVAIVRPGPIQGNMVHPYLKNRKIKRETEARGEVYQANFPKPDPANGPPDELEKILGKTLGVPLFQEQAMRIALDAAKFDSKEANELRKSMATFRHTGTISNHEKRMVDTMIERGYDPDFAKNCFRQIEGFGEYGFPESHACSFAHLVYISAWLKCDHPDVFAAALLNSQPMGFYAPAQIVRDAREHNVEVRHPDINASDWNCTLERRGGRRRRAMRLGLRMIQGFRQDWAETLIEARAAGLFESLAELKRRTGLPGAALDRLAAADALGSLDLGRRQGAWAAAGLPRRAPAPLFEAMGLDEADGPPPPALPAPSAGEDVVSDYQTLKLSLKGHPCGFLRPRLDRVGAIPCAQVGATRDGRRIRTAGVVLVRQQPGSAKGVVFLTIEDETGIANLVLWPSAFERWRPQAMGARMLLVTGRLQKSEEGIAHVVVERLDDWSAQLRDLSDDMVGEQHGRTTGRRHPRDMRIMPASRDFH
ncbi:MAG: error-prone DNA polymerase [Sphingomonadaceae bacterium]|nr:error-prone DNA polymerase [Sphingomonadaceae bacterium]